MHSLVILIRFVMVFILVFSVVVCVCDIFIYYCVIAVISGSHGYGR